MNTKNMISKAVSAFAITALTFSTPLLASAKEANPALGNACGLDVVLVLDHSTSLSAQDLADEKDAAKAFVDAFLPGTPTTMGVVSFGSSASTLQNLTSNAADVKSAIDSITLSGSTNWADALTDAAALLEGGLDRSDATNPDLIVLFSDGEPNVGGSGEAQADAAKTSASSMPIRILGVGIGSGVTTSSFATITDGASTTFSPPDAISADTDVILSNFDDLANTLGNLASALCEDVNGGGKINVQNNNGANVQNEVVVGSNTGGNNANGGRSGYAGNGGNVNNSNNNNTGGRGGNTGNGGMGGSIFTGNAVATGNVANMVNYNTTRVNGCNCGASMITVRNNNGANVGNGLSVFARTGHNNADGGNVGGRREGGAGNGGSVNNSNNNNTGGNGGNSGQGDEELPGGGGAGGWIQTGVADSLGSITNTVNRNRTRIGGGLE